MYMCMVGLKQNLWEYPSYDIVLWHSWVGKGQSRGQLYSAFHIDVDCICTSPSKNTKLEPFRLTEANLMHKSTGRKLFLLV